MSYSISVPSSLTIKGTRKSTFLQASITPDAMVAQLTMPPKTFTKIALTFGSVNNLSFYVIIPSTNLRSISKAVIK